MSALLRWRRDVITWSAIASRDALWYLFLLPTRNKSSSVLSWVSGFFDRNLTVSKLTLHVVVTCVLHGGSIRTIMIHVQIVQCTTCSRLWIMHYCSTCTFPCRAVIRDLLALAAFCAKKMYHNLIICNSTWKYIVCRAYETFVNVCCAWETCGVIVEHTLHVHVCNVATTQ